MRKRFHMKQKENVMYKLDKKYLDQIARKSGVENPERFNKKELIQELSEARTFGSQSAMDFDFASMTDQELINHAEDVALPGARDMTREDLIDKLEEIFEFTPSNQATSTRKLKSNIDFPTGSMDRVDLQRTRAHQRAREIGVNPSILQVENPESMVIINQQNMNANRDGYPIVQNPHGDDFLSGVSEYLDARRMMYGTMKTNEFAIIVKDPQPGQSIFSVSDPTFQRFFLEFYMSKDKELIVFQRVNGEKQFIKLQPYYNHNQRVALTFTPYEGIGKISMYVFPDIQDRTTGYEEATMLTGLNHLKNLKDFPVGFNTRGFESVALLTNADMVESDIYSFENLVVRRGSPQKSFRRQSKRPSIADAPLANLLKMKRTQPQDPSALFQPQQLLKRKPQQTRAKNFNPYTPVAEELVVDFNGSVDLLQATPKFFYLQDIPDYLPRFANLAIVDKHVDIPLSGTYGALIDNIRSTYESSGIRDEDLPEITKIVYDENENDWVVEYTSEYASLAQPFNVFAQESTPFLSALPSVRASRSVRPSAPLMSALPAGFSDIYNTNVGSSRSRGF